MIHQLRRVLRIGATLTLAYFPVFVRAASPRPDDLPDKWIEVRSPHFVVSTDAADEDGRRIAGQFEQIRAMFHGAFPALRVDPPQQILILAAKNETTMKLLLPDEWAVPGHIHPAGLFQSGEDKDYVVMRLDAAGTTPFHIVYHEYTHALLHLNFHSRIPLWLDEGLAEFFGNSALNEKESRTGTIDKTHLYVLGKNELLPIATLLAVNADSPYYNEANPASIFYAESWVVVHYLLLDPAARQQHLLGKFLAAWEKSGDPTAAAREAFGDLGEFEQTIRRYARQTSFAFGAVPAHPESRAETYSVRAISPGEVLALRGDLFTHRNMLDQAQPLLEQAVQLEPDIAVTHESLGFYDFREKDLSGADAEMKRAIELGSANFMALYCRGLLLVRAPLVTKESNEEALAYLERAARLNPQFAPTFEALTQAYSRSPETERQALDAARKALELDPDSRSYEVNLVYALLNNQRIAEAKSLGEKLRASAASADEARAAQAVLDRVQEEEEWANEGGGSAEVASLTPLAATTDASVHSSPAGSTTSPNSAVSRRRLPTPERMAVDGVITAIDCSASPEITLVLALAKVPMSFHGDFQNVGISGVSEESTPGIESCKQWAGRRVKIWFRAVLDKDYSGEITKIHFF